jgi:hypothetical protein
VDKDRKSAIIAICATILAARKLSTAPPNSPAEMSTISNAISMARKIVDRIERDSRNT